MELEFIEKIHSGKFISRYNLHYKTVSGKPIVYEIISRNANLQTQTDLHEGKNNAVVLILHDKSGEKILLNREFRMAVGEWIYNFPAGLIDPGETIEQAAARELREETGLTFEVISDIWKESYSAIGFGNEKNVVVEGIASGKILPSDSENEEIEARWFSKEEIQVLLKKERFAARTQSYCVLWCKK
jgi:ADP-ribose pyrophosphatase